MDHEEGIQAEAEPKGPQISTWEAFRWIGLRSFVGLITIVSFVMTCGMIGDQITAHPLIGGDCRCLSMDGVFWRFCAVAMLAGIVGWFKILRDTE